MPSRGAREHVSRKLTRARLACPRKVHHQLRRQAAALFLIAPTIAVSMAPPAPPAITCEMIPSTLRLPDCAAAVIAGSNKVTIWPSTPPPIKPEIMLPIIPRSKVGDDFPTATPPSAPVTRLIKICSMLDLPAFRLASRLSRSDLAVELVPSLNRDVSTKTSESSLEYQGRSHVEIGSIQSRK